MAELLEVNHVSRVYEDDSGEKVEAVRDVTFSVSKGEFVSIIGTSGCGKTTLLRTIAGLDTPQSGEALLEGRVMMMMRSDR